MSSLRGISRILVAAAAIAMSMGALAQTAGPAGVDVEIVDRSDGKVLRIHYFEGRRYVIGRPGSEYSIRLANHGSGRVLAVMSVDGVNVITGDTASTSQSGYVFGPGERSEVAGWRKSMSRTAAFYFTAIPNSFAARSGRPDDVGVIGIAMSKERVAPVIPNWSTREFDRRGKSADAAPPNPAAVPFASAPEGARQEAQAGSVGKLAEAPSPGADVQPGKPAERLGTGHGRNEQSLTRYTGFERASETPIETIAIYYDSYENLLAQGVPVADRDVARNHARPFPVPAHFVPDPR
jgi:hypothetical protein